MIEPGNAPYPAPNRNKNAIGDPGPNWTTENCYILILKEKADQKDVNRRKYGTPYRIRTCDLRLRRPLLYPTELRAHGDGTDYTSGSGYVNVFAVSPQRSAAVMTNWRQ